MKRNSYDAAIIGSGPNGLAAAIKLAQAGLSVILFEAKNTIGGGTRSAELTLPGFVHDICSAIHPLAVTSPFFQSLALDAHGLKWIQPSIPLAHPFEKGSAAILDRSILLTSHSLLDDSNAYKKLMEPFVKNWDDIRNDLLGPLRFPQHPIMMARFAFLALRSCQGLSKAWFKGKEARGFFAGLCAHSIMPLDRPLTAAFGLILAILGHVVGWPIPQGGSQSIANALGSLFTSLGGEIYTNAHIDNIDQLPPSRVILCDVTPKQLLQIAGQHLPAGYIKKIQTYRYGPGVFKMDWALNNPIPWKSTTCTKAGTIHVGGTAEEIEQSEKEVSQNQHPEKPYIILAQQSLFDSTRAPLGKHTAWGYCHVPNGSDVDMTDRIENQIERFAPGFKDCILARNTKTAQQLEAYNSNYVGGDINGGMQDVYQLFTRPVARCIPYSTPVKNLYICSSSTPPGGGVHGMCGYHAACNVLKKIFK